MCYIIYTKVLYLDSYMCPYFQAADVSGALSPSHRQLALRQIHAHCPSWRMRRRTQWTAFYCGGIWGLHRRSICNHEYSGMLRPIHK